MSSDDTTQNGKNVNSDAHQFMDYASFLVTSYEFPVVLNAAVELDLLEIMAKSGEGAFMSPLDIAAQMPGCKNPNAPDLLDRILYLLATHAVVTATLDPVDHGGASPRGKRLYALAPASKYFVRNSYGASFAPWLALTVKSGQKPWRKLKDVVLEGGAALQNSVGEDVNAFGFDSREEMTHRAFHAVMRDHSIVLMEELLGWYKGFEHLEHKRLVDVGGGLGSALRMIIGRYPTIEGVNFDLPHILQDAPTYSGVEHVGGDMFREVPKGDAILLKWILHDWNDEECITLLKNCHKALPSTGKIIVPAQILPEIPDTSIATKYASIMDIMMINIGGRERTKEEYLALAKEAGFSGIKFEVSTNSFWIMEFFK